MSRFGILSINSILLYGQSDSGWLAHHLSHPTHYDVEKKGHVTVTPMYIGGNSLPKLEAILPRWKEIVSGLPTHTPQPTPLNDVEKGRIHY